MISPPCVGALPRATASMCTCSRSKGGTRTAVRAKLAGEHFPFYYVGLLFIPFFPYKLGWSDLRPPLWPLLVLYSPLHSIGFCIFLHILPIFFTS